MPSGAAVALAVLALAAPISAGCDGTARDGSVEIFAAASLERPLRAAEPVLESRTRTPVVIVTGASSALRVQVEQGARADIFLSADVAQADALVAADLAEGPPIAFASDRVVIVASREAAPRLRDAYAIGRDGVRLVMAAEGVPIERYASVLVDRLARLPGAPPDFAARVAANVVSREDDVRAVLARVELGEADAAIVYATTAAAADVEIVPVPAGADVRATYACVLIRSAAPAGPSQAALAWLLGPDGAAVLALGGFLPP